MKYPNLFKPIKIRGQVFKNRIMSAPLGAWVFSPDNYMFDYAISMFEERAKGGAASICVGHTEVHYKDDDSDGFGLYFDLRKNEGTCAATTFAQAVQQYGCHASIELNYGGLAKGDLMFPGQKEAYDINGDCPPGGRVKPMTPEKIQEIIGNFAKCVEKMRICGFHMVTIHGAHGWMPAVMLNSKTNHRTDEYGGSLENRMRYPLELMQAVRKAAGNQMVVEYRISGVDPDEDPEGFEEQMIFLNRLEGLADIIHVSASGSDRPTATTFPSYLAPRGLHRKLSAAIKQRGLNIPVAVVGAISDPVMAEEIIANGEADFVAMCRTLTADPYWPTKARRGEDEDIRPCIACYNCLDQMHKTHFHGCDVNPRCGMEHRVPHLAPATESKSVAVVGGGPAGMVAAITACDRGYDVTIVEKQEELGGLLRLSDNNQIKWMLNNYKKYLIHQVEKRSIRVLLNTPATEELIRSLGVDSVIVASGSMPIVPKIPGVDEENVFTCIRAHYEPEKLGERIVVVGGNLVGCEEALHLKSIGKQEVTVVEMTDTIHSDGGMVAGQLDDELEKYNVQVVTRARCTEIRPDGAVVEINGEQQLIPADTIILAVGMNPQYQVYEDLMDAAAWVEPVGDCIKAGTVRGASRTAFYVANNL